MRIYSFILCILFSTGCKTEPPKRNEPKKLNQLYQSKVNIMYPVQNDSILVSQYTVDSPVTEKSDTTIQGGNPNIILVHVPERTQYELTWKGVQFFMNANSQFIYDSRIAKSFIMKGKIYIESDDTINISTYPCEIRLYPGSAITVINYEWDDDHTVALIKGKAEIRYNDALTGTLTTAGQQLSWKNPSEPTVKQLDTADVLGWRYGQLAMAPCTLTMFLNEVGRWIGRDFSFVGDYDNYTMEATTIYLGTSLDAYVKILKAGFEIDVVDQGDKIYVYQENKSEK